MITNEELLRKSAWVAEDEDQYGAFEEWLPRPGLSLCQAVEVSFWCANQNVGANQRCAALWFEVFHRCMTEAGFEYVAYRGQTLFAPPPTYPIDPGWTAVH
jgi:hypothetical protein